MGIKNDNRPKPMIPSMYIDCSVCLSIGISISDWVVLKIFPKIKISIPKLPPTTHLS